MGLFTKAKAKLSQWDRDRKRKEKSKELQRAKDLEKKAKHAAAIEKNMKRQEEAKKTIERVAKKQQENSTAYKIFKGFGEGMEKIGKATGQMPTKTTAMPKSRKTKPMKKTMARNNQPRQYKKYNDDPFDMGGFGDDGDPWG